MLHPVGNGVASDMEDGDLDLDFDLEEAEGDPICLTDHQIRAPDNEQAEWLKLELDNQLRDVMDLLKKGLRRWSEDQGPSEVHTLEQYKKDTLLTKRNAELMRATALHILARNYKSHCYDKIPNEIIRPVIRDLLAQVRQSSAEAKPDDKRKEEPILKVAITLSSDDEFIEQIKAAWPEEFSALLDDQDSDGKNALHHIFAWPDEKAMTIREADAHQVLKRAIELIPAAKGETIAAQDIDGNTPIHLAADYRQCYGRNEDYFAMFKEMVRKGDEFMKGDRAFNKKDESPILYSQATKNLCRRIMRELKQRGNKGAAAAVALASKSAARSSGLEASPPSRRDTESPVDGSAASEENKDSEVIESSQSQDGESKLEGSLQRRGSRSMSIADGPKEGNHDDSQRMPRSSQPQQAPSTGLQENTPKPASENTAASDTTSAKKFQAYNNILQFIRLHYIRTRPDMEARDLTHGKDASGVSLFSFSALSRCPRTTKHRTM